MPVRTGTSRRGKENKAGGIETKQLENGDASRQQTTDVRHRHVPMPICCFASAADFGCVCLADLFARSAALETLVSLRLPLYEVTVAVGGRVHGGWRLPDFSESRGTDHILIARYPVLTCRCGETVSKTGCLHKQRFTVRAAQTNGKQMHQINR